MRPPDASWRCFRTPPSAHLVPLHAAALCRRFEVEYAATLNDALMTLGVVKPFEGGDLTQVGSRHSMESMCSIESMHSIMPCSKHHCQPNHPCDSCAAIAQCWKGGDNCLWSPAPTSVSCSGPQVYLLPAAAATSTASISPNGELPAQPPGAASLRSGSLPNGKLSAQPLGDASLR